MGDMYRATYLFHWGFIAHYHEERKKMQLN